MAQQKFSVAKTFLFVALPVTVVSIGIIFLAMECRNYLLTSDRFQVKKVEVFTQGVADTEAILAQAGIKIGSNIFSINLSEVRAKVEKNLWVESAIISRALPDTIQIRYRKQEPVALLSVDSLYYLNKEGNIFARVKKEDSLRLPLIQVEGVWKDGNKKKLEAAVKLLAYLRESAIFSEEDLGDLTISLTADSQTTPYFLTMHFPPKNMQANEAASVRTYGLAMEADQVPQQLKRWEAVMRHLIQDGKNPKLIRLDLGKKVVVKLDR